MFGISVQDSNWLDSVWENIKVKMSKVAANVGDKIPYTTVDGRYDDKFKEDPTWWTNGFWPGILWLMYMGTQDEKYREMAEKAELRLDKVLFGLDGSFEGLHHDVGFMWHLSSVANYRITGNPESKIRGLIAANHLASRFNIKGGFITAWNGKEREGWSIIDTMMNLPLLYWASNETGYSRYRFIAEAHADKTAENVIRPDGSVIHIIEYDTNTGEVIKTYGGQGYGTGSSWSRGQSWAIYGFALSYLHTQKTLYLDLAKKVAHYFISCIQDSFIPTIDFRSPDAPLYIDTTAGAIAACGMIEISKHVPSFEKKLYLNTAIKILKSLEKEQCDWTDKTDSILKNGSESYNSGIHKSIIYGDFYFLEAIMKLKEKGICLW
ncbi:MAG: glycosyl hydrolase family 88 [Clostridiaceae bacterium]|nr:glycosyl hydrolase family 88 [Clostridiaceae bacterium]